MNTTAVHAMPAPDVFDDVPGGTGGEFNPIPLVPSLHQSAVE